jgi:uncharacterized protein YueI
MPTTTSPSYVQRFCKEAKIEFSRSRPYRKNDAPYVESKNWSMVRAYTGWRRYDTEEELKALQRLVKLVSIRSNLFMPQMKLTERIRIKGKVIKKYEMDTPLNRVLKLEEVAPKIKRELVKLRDRIDILKLSKDIDEIMEELLLVYERKLKRINNHA